MLKPTFNGSLMFPSEYVAAEELKGKDVNVTISKVETAKLKTNTGKMEKKFLLHFKGAGKPLVLNRTNARVIATMHGVAAEKWVGKRITLYPTTCEAFGQQTTCIRVRDRSPDDNRAPVDDFPNGHSDTHDDEATREAERHLAEVLPPRGGDNGQDMDSLNAELEADMNQPESLEPEELLPKTGGRKRV